MVKVQVREEPTMPDERICHSLRPLTWQAPRAAERRHNRGLPQTRARVEELHSELIHHKARNR